MLSNGGATPGGDVSEFVYQVTHYKIHKHISQKLMSLALYIMLVTSHIRENFTEFHNNTVDSIFVFQYCRLLSRLKCMYSHLVKVAFLPLQQQMHDTLLCLAIYILKS